YRLVVRSTDEDYVRGLQLTVAEWDTEEGVSVGYVAGDYTGITLYGGYRVRTERTESPFYVSDPEGSYIHQDRITVSEFTVTHAETGYYRLEVIDPNTGDVVRDAPYSGHILGEQSAVFDAVVLATGTHSIGIKELNTRFLVRMVNDSFLPS